MRMRLSLFGLLRSSGSCASKLKNLPDRDPPGAIIDVFEGQALGRSARILAYIYAKVKIWSIAVYFGILIELFIPPARQVKCLSQTTSTFNLSGLHLKSKPR